MTRDERRKCIKLPISQYVVTNQNSEIGLEAFRRSSPNQKLHNRKTANTRKKSWISTSTYVGFKFLKQDLNQDHDDRISIKMKIALIEVAAKNKVKPYQDKHEQDEQLVNTVGTF